MPTQIEYALMSANVYGNYPDVGPVNPVRSGPNTLPVPDGWTQMSAASGYKQNDTSTGFMAGVYVSGSQVVISYCGTTAENSLDWTMGNIPAGSGLDYVDVAFPLVPTVATQVVQAALLYMKVLNDPQFAGKSVSFTGHSLGGGLASLMAVYFNKPAVVFDEAFFVKSADSTAVLNALRTALEDAGYSNLPPALANYQTDTSAVSYVTNTWDPSPTRLERQAQVTQINPHEGFSAQRFSDRKRRFGSRARLALVACATALLTACGTDTIEWKEEVLLHDGRMIVVERKAKAESSGFPNANRGRDLEFELHYEPMNVHWKGTEQQSTFEIVDGVAYLVVSGGDEREICKGKPPDHIPQKFLKHQDGQWVEIDQVQFPMDEANFTLYLRYWGSEPSEDARGLITWKRKASRDGYPTTTSQYDINNIPRRPYKFREFFETNRFTCARFQQP
jgi:hypothetical protein